MANKPTAARIVANLVVAFQIQSDMRSDALKLLSDETIKRNKSLERQISNNLETANKELDLIPVRLFRALQDEMGFVGAVKILPSVFPTFSDEFALAAKEAGLEVSPSTKK